VQESPVVADYRQVAFLRLNGGYKVIGVSGGKDSELRVNNDKVTAC
jgi:hypothetical protein